MLYACARSCKCLLLLDPEVIRGHKPGAKQRHLADEVVSSYDGCQGCRLPPLWCGSVNAVQSVQWWCHGNVPTLTQHGHRMMFMWELLLHLCALVLSLGRVPVCVTVLTLTLGRAWVCVTLLTLSLGRAWVCVTLLTLSLGRAPVCVTLLTLSVGRAPVCVPLVTSVWPEWRCMWVDFYPVWPYWRCE